MRAIQQLDSIDVEGALVLYTRLLADVDRNMAAAAAGGLFAQGCGPRVPARAQEERGQRRGLRCLRACARLPSGAASARVRGKCSTMT